MIVLVGKDCYYIHHSCTTIPRGVYLHHILQLWQMKRAYLWHYKEHYNLNLFSEVHVKIQEQLLEWDTSNHTSLENKTVTIVSYMCLIYLHLVFGCHDYMIVSAISSEIPLSLYKFMTQDMLSGLHLVRLTLSFSCILYGNHKDVIDFGSNKVHGDRF